MTSNRLFKSVSLQMKNLHEVICLQVNSLEMSLHSLNLPSRHSLPNLISTQSLPIYPRMESIPKEQSQFNRKSYLLSQAESARLVDAQVGQANKLLNLHENEAQCLVYISCGDGGLGEWFPVSSSQSCGRYSADWCQQRDEEPQKKAGIQFSKQLCKYWKFFQFFE